MRLFDTTFLVDLVNKDPGSGRLAEKVEAEKSFRGVSVVTVYEYLRGVYYVYSNSKQLSEKLESAERELSAFQAVPLTPEISRRSAQLQAALERKGEMLGINDLYFASTALSLNLTLVTRNTQDFRRVPGLKTESY
ncbi:MAG TPA: type II toxin-antitoxin system VapC family toxin [Candidatus Dormibacteraeota bacterium]|nr:type II toxin-antitoxin system VapC family toxin [Candidatus Dormibacteraeota bacterium]